MWSSLKTATWLGWQIESNWASPALFALYSIVKPLTSAAILVVMFGLITQGNFASPAFSYMYIGNAFYMYVGAVLAGMAQAVVDDRERFLMLKSMYVAPVHIPMYLVGRGIARCVTTTLSVGITIVCGVVFLDLQVSQGDVRWGMFIAVVVTGMAMLAMMGLTLASVVLVIVHHSWVVGEAVAAALYLFCGAVFPLEVLPWWLRPLGYLVPVTYWLELVRRSLVGRVAGEYPTLAGFSDAQLMTVLALITFAFTVIATATFRRCNHLARERGLIDRTTNY